MSSEEAAQGDVAHPPTAIGAIVMACGIFASAALEQLSVPAIVPRLFAGVVLLLWLGLALALLRSIDRDGIARRTRPMVGSFALGTWVAATALMPAMAAGALPGVDWLGLLFFALAVLLWLSYMPQAIAKLACLARKAQAPVNGSILLTTVATQSLVMPLLELFPDRALARDLAVALIALGALCYGAGALLVLRRYTTRRFSLAADWDNTNCILHGAVSITGLAAVTSGFFPSSTLSLLWRAAFALFLMVEAIEIARAASRLRLCGWRRGLLRHHVSQWARTFTFGMFYAFTLALAQQAPVAAVSRAQALVLGAGPSLVLLLLLAELGLLADEAARFRR